MKTIIMAFGALAIAGAAPVLAQSTMPTPAPDGTMAPPAAPTPPAPDGSMTPAQPGSMVPGSTPPSSAMPGDPPAGGATSGSMSNGGTSPGTMPSSGMQSNMPAATTGPLPKCTAKMKDRCDQSTTSERYALSADQAMKTGGVGDRRSDNAGAMGKPMAKKHTMHRRMARKPAAAAAPAPAAM